MEILSFDKYLSLSKEEAYNLYLNEKNIRILKIVLYILVAIFFIYSIVQLAKSQRDFFDIPVAILTFFALLFLSIRYKKIVNLDNVRKYISIVLLGILAVVILAQVVDIQKGIPPGNNNSLMKIETGNNGTGKIEIKTTADSTTDWGTLIILSLLVFRLGRRQIIEIFSYAFFAPLVLHLVVLNNFSVSNDLSDLILALIFLGLALYLEKRRRIKFYEQYGFYYRRSFESIRMKKELDAARQIQLSMLPENQFRIKDLEISGLSHPASEVGGDYFDYFKISEHEVAVFICDVSGHGVASGLMLAGLRGGIHLILEDTSDPVVVIDKLNRMVRKTQNKKMFVTAIFAVIDLKNNLCRLFNAGHLPPYKISGNSGDIFKIRKHSITLGAVDKIINGTDNYEVVFDFNENDKLLLYTDGVNEAMNHLRHEYGFDKIEKILQTNSDKTPSKLLELLHNDIKNFINDTAQRDDLTILTVGRIGL